jgi:hypothetical protein
MTDQKVIRALADAKHVVYEVMRDVTGSDVAAANLARAYAADHTVTLRPVQMDVKENRIATVRVLPTVRPVTKLPGDELNATSGRSVTR